jgi:23S rRNA pseudouridine1911/1915/1917 synthase
MPEFRVAVPDAGARLDVALARHSGLSRALVQRAIADGRVTVDGSAATKRRVLNEGETVRYEIPVVSSASLQAETVPYTLVYEDDWLLVVDKPAGVVVHPAPGHEHGTLVHGLVDHGPAGGHESRPGIVHRLDRDTSGLLIVARSAVAHRRLVEAMARRAIQRRYVTLVCGTPPHPEGVIDVPIGRHVRDRKRMSVHTARGRPAVTHFAVRQRFEAYTLLDVRLETGRTHQIRVHLAAVGCPVAGDVVYGGRPRPEGLARQFLHAARLAFPHPESGDELAFESPLPGDLTGFLRTLSPS